MPMLSKTGLALALLVVTLAATGCFTGETPDVSATVAAELTRLAPTSTQTATSTPAPTNTPTLSAPQIQATKNATYRKQFDENQKRAYQNYLATKAFATSTLYPTPTKSPTPHPTTTPSPTATPRPPTETISKEPGIDDRGIYCHYGIKTIEYHNILAGKVSKYCAKLPLEKFQCPEGYARKQEWQRPDWAYSGYDKEHDIKNQCYKVYIAPSPTPLPYKISYKYYNYSAPNHGVFDISICFEEHTHHDDGKAYAQDVRYHTKYKDRQGETKSLTITFVLFDRGKRTEHIQAYESSSPGTFDDAPTSAITEAFKGIKSGKWQPYHGGCN